MYNKLWKLYNLWPNLDFPWQRYDNQGSNCRIISTKYWPKCFL